MNLATTEPNMICRIKHHIPHQHNMEMATLMQLYENIKQPFDESKSYWKDLNHKTDSVTVTCENYLC